MCSRALRLRLRATTAGLCSDAMKPAAALDGGALDMIDAKDEAVRRCAACVWRAARSLLPRVVATLAML